MHACPLFALFIAVIVSFFPTDYKVVLTGDPPRARHFHSYTLICSLNLYSHQVTFLLGGKIRSINKMKPHDDYTSVKMVLKRVTQDDMADPWTCSVEFGIAKSDPFYIHISSELGLFNDTTRAHWFINNQLLRVKHLKIF